MTTLAAYIGISPAILAFLTGVLVGVNLGLLAAGLCVAAREK
jgi:hypothetical protein